ncbi:MAG: hypothetical protein AAF483_04605 [Planctomycetota bacterium]
MAFGQYVIVVSETWGVAPGYDEAWTSAKEDLSILLSIAVE